MLLFIHTYLEKARYKYKDKIFFKISVLFVNFEINTDFFCYISNFCILPSIYCGIYLADFFLRMIYDTT